jgi:hypothetical protein
VVSVGDYSGFAWCDRRIEPVRRLGPGELQRGHAALIEIEKRRDRRALLTVHKP